MERWRGRITSWAPQPQRQPGSVATAELAGARDVVVANGPSGSAPVGVVFEGANGVSKVVTPEAFARTLDAAGSSVWVTSRRANPGTAGRAGGPDRAGPEGGGRDGPIDDG
jgi:hypothetical protein